MYGNYHTTQLCGGVEKNCVTILLSNNNFTGGNENNNRTRTESIGCQNIIILYSEREREREGEREPWVIGFYLRV